MLVLFTITLPVQALDAQKSFRDFVVDRWDVEQGLPQITVLATAQDAQGYLWFGTQAGIARFDGMHFQRFNTQDAPSLNGNVQALLFDDAQRLWIGTARGLTILENATFRNITPVAQSFPVYALARQHNTVLIASTDGIYTYENNALRRLHALSAPALSLINIDDALWVGSTGQAFRITNNTIESFPLPAALKNAAINTLAMRNNTLWAGTSRGLYQLHHTQWLAAAGPEIGTTTSIENLYVDRHDNLWLSTPQLLARLRPDATIERISELPGGSTIRSVFEDRDGNLWLGTQAAGVLRVWNGYARHIRMDDGLASALIWTLEKAADGSIWIGTGNGVNRWHQGKLETLIQGAALPHPDVYTLLPENGQTWIGTRLGVFLLRNGILESPTQLAAIRDAQVNGILRDRKKRLWFATSQGVFLLDGQRLTQYAERAGLSDPRVRIVHETRHGRILLGTPHGLYEWGDNRITNLGESTGLNPDIAVTALAELQDGRWVVGSSDSNNLHIFNGTRWQSLGAKQHLPANIPFFFTEQDGALWVAGMQGVYRLPFAQLDQALSAKPVPLKADIIINSGMDQQGGQVDKCCNGTGHGRGLLDGKMLWFPTRDGILQVASNDLPIPPEHHVLIESVHEGEQHFDTTNDTLQLPIDARSPKISFTLPNFNPAYAPDLRYRLKGHSDTWEHVTNASQRLASYSNLPPGQYTFEVLDFNQPTPETTAARLHLIIPPHFQETLLFRLVLLAALFFLIWLIYLTQRYSHERQRHVLEQQVLERTAELQEANTKLKELSFTDALTGLHNRRYLSQQIPLDLSFYDRNTNYQTGKDAAVFVLLDIDHFKRVNDTWGHAAGDRLLEQVAQLLSDMRRQGDYVARWGGEEFLMVLRPLPRGSLPEIGNRICSRIADHVFDLGNGVTHHVTVSVGLVECPPFYTHPHLLAWEQIITLADRAMYRVKTSGRNGWLACCAKPGAALPNTLSSPIDNPQKLLDLGALEFCGDSLHTG